MRTILTVAVMFAAVLLLGCGPKTVASTESAKEEEPLLLEPVIAQIVTMIAGEDDQRILETPLFFKKHGQPADMVIDLLDQPHIGRDDRLAYFVTLKILAFLIVHERVIDRMGVLAFGRIAMGCLNIVHPVHVVVGRRHDIGPMGLI